MDSNRDFIKEYDKIKEDAIEYITDFIKRNARLCYGHQMFDFYIKEQADIGVHYHYCDSLETMNLEYIYLSNNELFLSGKNIFGSVHTGAESVIYEDLLKIIDALSGIKKGFIKGLKNDISKIIDEQGENGVLNYNCETYSFIYKGYIYEVHGATNHDNELVFWGYKTKEDDYNDSIDTDITEEMFGDDYERILNELYDDLKICRLKYEKEYKDLVLLLNTKKNKEIVFPNVEESLQKIVFHCSNADCDYFLKKVYLDNIGRLTMLLYFYDSSDNKCDYENLITIRENEIDIDFIHSILLFENDCYIMDITNSHSKELVDKINQAYKTNKDNFIKILYAIALRDEDEWFEITDKKPTLEYAKLYAYDILMRICDDYDLETILRFCRTN